VTLSDGFWTERLRVHGHTGWSDPFLYAYDQLERLALVSALLDGLPRRGQRAIDFGCGTGDFSRLLLGRGYRVCGYDPFVDPGIADPAFTHARQLEEIPFEPATVDLVLSVTVLDHLVEDRELHDALERLRGLMSPQGRLLLLEYGLDSESDRTQAMRDSRYQAFRTLPQWKEALASHSLVSEGLWGVPHPVDNPSSGFRAFQDRFLVRALARLRLERHAPAVASRLLRREARKAVARHPVRPSTDLKSPLKLMLFRPSA
jgi:SAM-dependent methyltransferase